MGNVIIPEDLLQKGAVPLRVASLCLDCNSVVSAPDDRCPHCSSQALLQLDSVLNRETTRPAIVCLCGSTRFYEAFQQAAYDLTMAGKIVLSVGFYPHAKALHGQGEGVGHDGAQKLALDELHKRKIDLADEVLVLNVGGYIGSSTRGEIDYALAHGKPVRYLEVTDAVL